MADNADTLIADLAASLESAHQRRYPECTKSAEPHAHCLTCKVAIAAGKLYCDSDSCLPFKP